MENGSRCGEVTASILSCLTMALVILACSACKLNYHDDVYQLVSAKGRMISTVTISPGAGADYAFTQSTQPSITIACPVSGAEIFYSIDGGEYQSYTAPFTLPIADMKVDQSFTVNAYVSHPEYRTSEPVSQTYRFVASIVPAPAISPGAGTEYAFTYSTQPSIAITCPLSGATAFYSIDGGAYQQYTAPFSLSIADAKVDQSFTVTAYSSHPNYQSSGTVSQAYRFVATAAPSPTITAAASSPALETSLTGIYRFDKPPVITLSCPIASAAIWYSVNDGSTYTRYAGPFSLPVPSNRATSATVTVRAYASIDTYANSASVSEDYRFYGSGTIVTIVGQGAVPGFTDGDGTATSALMDSPLGLYVDAVRSVYVADSVNGCVRKILTDGTISTLAGIPRGPGYNDTDCPATLARLNGPSSLTADESTGTLYIADNLNYVVRTVPLAGGNISNYAGTPGSPAIAGTLTVSSDGTLCSSAIFGPVYGIYFDPVNNNLYIADNGSCAVWMVYNDGRDNRIHRFAGSGGGYSRDGGDGPDILACPLLESFAMTCIVNSFFLSDHGARKIRSINLSVSPHIVTTFVRPSGTPAGLAVMGSTLYYVDDTKNQVCAVDSGGSETVIAGTGVPSFSGDGGPAATATLNAPKYLFAVAGDGLYISDTNNHCVRKIILY